MAKEINAAMLERMVRYEYCGVPVVKCIDCDEELELQVCLSNAGYYAGRWCNCCGPFGRESGYFRTREEAQECVDTLTNS